MAIFGSIIMENGLGHPPLLIVEDRVVLYLQFKTWISLLSETHIVREVLSETSSYVASDSSLPSHVGSIEPSDLTVNVFLHFQVSFEVINLVVVAIHLDTSLVIVTS
jgi:hypothetical protein